MNRLLALALFLPVTAAANTVWTPTGPAVPLCSMDGTHFFPARNGICYASDAAKVLPTTIVAPPGRCEDNRLLVMMMDGTFMCAADLTEPKR